MATRSRYAIIPLRLDNKGFAEIGEPSFSWDNAQYELKMTDGTYINPFEVLGDDLQQQITENHTSLTQLIEETSTTIQEFVINITGEEPIEGIDDDTIESLWNAV